MAKRETELAKPVADWLRTKGYVVYAEIFPQNNSPCDLVGYRAGDEGVVIVELKRSLTRHVMKQAAVRQLAAYDVYVAVGTKPRRAGIRVCDHYGLGLLSVKTGVAEALRPHGESHVWSVTHDDLLCCIAHSTPSDLGGMPCLKGVGPARDVARRVRDYLREHPGTTWKTLFAKVPNEYSSHQSLRQVMNNRFGIFVTSEEWKREHWDFVQAKTNNTPQTHPLKRKETS